MSQASGTEGRTRFPAEVLETQAARLGEAAGLCPDDAQILARALVDADLHGVSTHGLSRLGIYLRRINLGLIDPRAELGVDRRRPAALALDAANGVGQVQAVKALRMMMPLSEQCGVSCATIRNSQHLGALSYYANLAAARGFILLATTNGEPAMSPTGGFDAFFGTNPVAVSFPTGRGFPVKIDLSTSAVARGNIIAASRQGRPIPAGWALDVNGEPTTDAGQALLGTVLSMAGHKGYALALMVEMLSGVLSGSAVGPEVGSMYKNLDRRQDVGHFFCLIHIDAFMDRETFLDRVDRTIDAVKAGRRMAGVDEILVPGERSSRTAAANRRMGVPLDGATLGELEEACARLKVVFSLPRHECR